MAPAKDPTIAAVETVHAALKDLDPINRQRVLASVYALLDIAGSAALTSAPGQSSSRLQLAPTSSAKPVAIRELIQEKKPTTHPEFIALFAYYREKHQNLPTFSRAILADYYGTSREKPPKNYDRDFVKAITRGWIHEDGENSYITSKGVEAVESGFSDFQRATSKKRSQKPKTAIKKTPRKHRN